MLKHHDILDLQSPYAFYEEMRSSRPIFFDEKSKYWIITKYDDVMNIMKNEAGFSARLDRVNYSDISPEALATLCPINFQSLYGLSTTENPSHDKVKRVLMPAWHELEKSLKPQIKQLVRESLLKIKGKKKFDILADVFNPLPARIIFLILGISDSDVQQVKDWSRSRLQLTWGDKSEQQQHANNIVAYWRFCEDLIEKKMLFPGDDLPSRLLKYYYKEQITLKEIQLLCYGLIFSGHMTTSAFLAEALKTLVQSGLWKIHKEANIPFTQSAEEMLRLCPSAFTRRRIALSDFKIGDHNGRKGDELLLVIGSANRDQDVFSDPNEVNIYRSNAKAHLTLGRGFHYCIGARLVKLEYSLVMSAIQRNFPELKLSTDNVFNYPQNISIRALDSLLVDV